MFFIVEDSSEGFVFVLLISIIHDNINSPQLYEIVLTAFKVIKHLASFVRTTFHKIGFEVMTHTK